VRALQISNTFQVRAFQISNTLFYTFTFSVQSPEFSPCAAAAMSTTTASGDGAPSLPFDTPMLDRESAALLHSISEHGGYAYVSMAALAAGGDIRAAEAAREMAWEQLHSGPWHSVLPVWRDAYSMACLYVARQHYGNGEYREALRVLDLGIIMGGTLLRKDLDSAVSKVSEQTRRRVRVSDLGDSVHRLVDREFDVAEVRSVPLCFLLSSFFNQHLRNLNCEGSVSC